MNQFTVLFLLCLPTLSFSLSLDMYQIPSTTTLTLNGVQPRLRTTIDKHLVEISIGTPPTTHYLIFDTASSLTWLQCEQCTNCYPQANPIYNSSKSETFRVIQCFERNCTGVRCPDGICQYRKVYANGARTQGVYASESFHFPNTSSSSTASLHGIIFGCGKSQRIGEPATTLIEGVAGFGPGPSSLVRQLGEHAKQKFSHCFRLYTGDGMTRGRLRLGDDAKLSGANVQRVPMLKDPIVNSYYLPLTEVSVGSEQVRFEEGMFSPAGRYDGFAIDSGTAKTLVATGPYLKIKAAFIDYYKQFNLREFFINPEMICYNSTEIQRLQEPFEHATMTLHFGTAKYIVEATELLMPYVEGMLSCVTVFRNNLPVSILGRDHQVDHRITYDLGRNEISFVPADCNRVL